MADRKASREDAASPHVSLRQAVRPVVVAYGVLLREQQTAGALKEEAETLLDATEELLRKLGLVHLLTAGAEGVIPDGVETDRAQRLVDAYAHTGMLWAKVLSSVTALAGLLIDQADWAAARLLADLIEESGEAKIAKYIESLLDNARKARIRTHDAMSASQVREAITALRALDVEERPEYIEARRVSLVGSVRAIARQSGKSSAVQQADELNTRLTNAILLSSLPEYALREDDLFATIIAILDLCKG